MLLGDKIRKYRKLKGYNQRQLGERVGFKPSTADVRINQYETGKMCPKADIRDKIAKVLEVDIEALSDINIQSIEDIIYVLFEMEEYYGLKVENHEGKYTLTFEASESNQDLISYLNIWASRKSMLIPDLANATKEQKIEYERWKSRFVSNVQEYYEAKEHEIDTHYNTISNAKYTLPEKTSDISILMRKLIESGLSIKTGYDNGPIFTFNVNELLSASKESELLFCEFYNLIHNLGIECPSKLQMPNSSLTISYHIPIPSFSVIKSQVDMVIDFYNGPSPKTDYDKDTFERDFIRSINEN